MQNNVIKHGLCVMNCFCGIIQRNIFLLKNPYRQKNSAAVDVQFCFMILFPLNFSFFLSEFSFFFHRQWRFTGQQGKRGDHLLFHPITSTSSRNIRHLLASLHVRSLSRISNRNACVYQAASRWYLQPYRITNWLMTQCLFVYLMIWF